MTKLRPHERVTANILAQLKQGEIPWLKPWRNSKRAGSIMFPHNAVSMRRYSGANVFFLWFAVDKAGYENPGFLTYNQAKEAGGHVRKGEKGETVFFWKINKYKERQDDGSLVEKTYPMLKAYTVFNVSQCDDLPERFHEAPEMIQDHDWHEFVTATGADVRHGGNEAFYNRQADYIQLPNPQQFLGEDHYKATALHELTHWTGDKKRLDRTKGKRFGDKAYAFEELVAELGAAFMCAEFGVTGQLHHAGYIQTWITMLEDHDKVFFTAASQAQKAVDFIRDTVNTVSGGVAEMAA